VIFLLQSQSRQFIYEKKGSNITAITEPLNAFLDTKIRELLLATVDPPKTKTIRYKADSHMHGDKILCTHFKIKKLEIDAGEYHPRVYRPVVDGSTDDLIDEVSLSSANMQFQMLMNRLEKVFQAVYPAKRNLRVYGHETRDIILLAAMEFESHCKAILRANNYTPTGSRGSDTRTSDYQKLCEPLKLKKYEARFQTFPALPLFRPFAKWLKAHPTQSIPWYECYNSVKHDRETNFKRATLENALNSIAACAIMITAQYGRGPISGCVGGIVGSLHITQLPNWDTTEKYFRPRSGEHWTPKNLSFQP
jgi:hypothetical protein